MYYKHFIIVGDLSIHLLVDSALKDQYLSLLEDFTRHSFSPNPLISPAIALP